MQDAMAQYEDLEPTEASLLAICETMPWELEAYAKSYEYAQTTGADTTWSPSIMERVIALYHRVMAYLPGILEIPHLFFHTEYINMKKFEFKLVVENDGIKEWQACNRV